MIPEAIPVFEKVEDLEKEIERLQRKINRLKGLPTDDLPIHSLLQFATDKHTWIIQKVSDNSWRHLTSHREKPLHQWIISAEESSLGDFSVYELRLKANPFYVYSNPVE